MKRTVTTLLLGLCLAGPLAFAEPTVQVKGGQTLLFPSENIREVLESCEVERIKPGHVKPDNRRLRFPVASGYLDLETLTVEVEHRGGMELSCFGGESTLGLINFRLDTTGGTPVITAMTTIDGSADERIPLLVPDVGENDLMAKGNKLQFKRIPMALTIEAADLLNTRLGLALEPETVIGEGSARINYFPVKRTRDEDDEEELEEEQEELEEEEEEQEEEEEEEEEEEQEEDAE